MAKNMKYSWSCDYPGCRSEYNSVEGDARYMSVPQGWAEISVTSLNEEAEETPDCLCRCHDEVEDDEGDNVAGHESYDCEICPEEKEWEMSMILCVTCYQRFSKEYQLPREEKE